MQCKGFHILANQLRQFDMTEDLIVACCDLMTGQTTGLYGMEESKFTVNVSGLSGTEPSEHLGYPVHPPHVGYAGQPDAAVTLLSLFDDSSSNAHLCREVLGTIRRIFARRWDLRASLLSNNLIPVVCDVVSAATGVEMEALRPASPISPAAVRGVRLPVPEVGDVFASAHAAGAPNEREAHEEAHDFDMSIMSRCGLLFSADALLQDVVAQYLCGLIASGTEQARGIQLLEDIIDCLGTWDMPLYHSRHMQRSVLRKALEQICLEFRSAQRNGGDQSLAHPVVALCVMAVDLIVFNSEGAEFRSRTVSPLNMAGAEGAAETRGGRAQNAGVLSPVPPTEYGYYGGGFAFICFVFNILRELVHPSDASLGAAPLSSGKKSALWPIRKQLARLVLHLLSPNQPRSFGEFILGNIVDRLVLLDALKEDVQTSTQVSLWREAREN
jgi:hypothetical protein